MPEGDIYEVNVDQTYNGQNLVNVLHFIQDGTDGSGSAREALGDIWVDNFQLPHLALMVTNVTIVQLRIRKLLPTQTQQFLRTINATGSQIESGLPPQQCAIISQKGQRGGPKGRRGAGHMKVSGVPLGATDAGRVNLNYATDMNTLGLVFADKLTDMATGFTFDSCVLSAVDSVARVIVHSGSTSRIRTVYSRSIGVGG